MSARDIVPVADRRARIELLRMRAAYDRVAMARAVGAVATELRPDVLMARMGRQAMRRYPTLLSLATGLFSKGRGGTPWARAAVGAWMLWRWWRRRR